MSPNPAEAELCHEHPPSATRIYLVRSTLNRCNTVYIMEKSEIDT